MTVMRLGNWSLILFCFLNRQLDEFESDDELDVDAILEAEQTALGKLRNYELRKQE